MAEEWFKQKERAAGVKRLLLSWFIYKHFGVFPLRMIAFFAVLISFPSLKTQNRELNTYFKLLFEYTGDKKYKPSFSNVFKLLFNYANSLVDKIRCFSGENLKIVFENPSDEQLLDDLIFKKKGAFFITSHIGNIEIMMSELSSSSPKVNIFMQQRQCETFNAFLKRISVKSFADIIPVEQIDVGTSIETEERLQNGEFVFMAGDRVSAANTEACYYEKVLNADVKFPTGVIRFAQMMNSEIFFITCALEDGVYKIGLKRFERSFSARESVKKLQTEYVSFYLSAILKYPFQFYQFFRFFDA